MGISDIGKTTFADVENGLATQHQAEQEEEEEQGLQAYPQDYLPSTYGNTGTPTSMDHRIADMILNIDVDENTTWDEYRLIFSTLLQNAGHIPGISTNQKRAWSRDFADIESLQSCQGQGKPTASRMRRLFFDMQLARSVCDVPGIGMSSVGAVITTRQQTDQTVKMPQVEQKRKKLFGVF